MYVCLCMFMCVCVYMCLCVWIFVCVYVFIQDPDPESDPKLCEKSDPDPKKSFRIHNTGFFTPGHYESGIQDKIFWDPGFNQYFLRAP